MGEKILNLNSRDSLNVGTGKNPIKIFPDKSSEQIITGGVEVKTRFQARVKRGIKERSVRLVSRLRNRHQARSYGIDYVKQWELFKEAGLPVVPTLRTKQEDNEYIYVTDLTADGSEIYGKSVFIKIMEPQGLSVYDFNPKYKLSSFLLKISTEEIKQEAYKIADLATDRSILLPADDPLELVVSPKGKWKLVILDLEQGIKNFSNRKDVIKDLNYTRVSQFIFWIEEIKKHFNKEVK
jgi:hypothetical protein